jgi:hypothetical protein
MALNAAFFQDVTMFQPNRPWVKWSSDENLFARRKGGSKVVDAVMAKLRFFVTAAIAVIGYSTYLITRKSYEFEGRHTIVGSVMGH